MIPDMGPHAAFIWLAYALMAVVIGTLIAWLVFDGRRQSRVLAQFDRRHEK